MFNIKIEEGALYYDKIRRREVILLNDELRNLTYQTILDVRSLFIHETIPRPLSKKEKCKLCSLVDICMPYLSNRSASEYLKTILYDL